MKKNFFGLFVITIFIFPLFSKAMEFNVLSLQTHCIQNTHFNQTVPPKNKLPDCFLVADCEDEDDMNESKTNHTTPDFLSFANLHIISVTKQMLTNCPASDFTIHKFSTTLRFKLWSAYLL
jgi:hypothetical protein